MKPKEPSQWRYIGKDFARVDAMPKTNGTAVYTIDVNLLDMLTCGLPLSYQPRIRFIPAPAGNTLR